MAAMLLGGVAQAHPEDEFCTADSGLDPALCAALAAADSAKAEPGSFQFGETEVTVVVDRSWHTTALLYIRLGFEHILPKGTDHILFVLALFFASTRFRPLVIQVSFFTVAHTLTLALAALGLVRIPAGIVEPLIALSIAFVAVENLVFNEMTRWRPAVVFGFGLFHGLGFASVLLDLGLPRDQFIPSLLSFNIGVELGQLSVILTAWFLLHRLFRRSWYRQRIVLPLSLLIAITGCWWAVQRISAGPL
jgi:hypothetical protein